MPAIGQIYQATYQQQCSGQLMETVLHFREKTGASTPTELANAASAFWPLLAEVQSTSVSYIQLILKQMTPIAFDEQLIPGGPPVVGSRGGGVTNNTLAIVITKRTGTAGKSHRGRMYIGGFSGDDQNVNFVSSGGITHFTTFINDVMAMYGPSGTDAHLQLGLYSRSIGGSSPFTVAGWQPVTRLDLQTVIGNQRRRRFGVGA